jgi:hypothetical protein
MTPSFDARRGNGRGHRFFNLAIAISAMVGALAGEMIVKSPFSVTTWDKMTEVGAVSHVG